METTPDQRRSAYWRKVRLLTKALLGVWFLVTFGVIYFARELSHVTVLGWPLSFYMAAQGIVIVYLVIVAVYVWGMRRLDSELLNGKANG
jgi:putative solute:sodium symporter small subunit